jgi:hypothetical protein
MTAHTPLTEKELDKLGEWGLASYDEKSRLIADLRVARAALVFQREFLRGFLSNLNMPESVSKSVGIAHDRLMVALPPEDP